MILHWYPGGASGRRGAGQDRAHRRRDLAACASRSTAYAGATRPRHRADRDQHRRTGMNTQPGALFAGRRVRDAAGERRVHRRLVERPQRIGTRRPRSPASPTTATSACSPAAPAWPTAPSANRPLNTPFAPYHALAMTSNVRPPRRPAHPGRHRPTRWSRRTPPAGPTATWPSCWSTRTRPTRKPVALELRRLHPGRRRADGAHVRQRRHRASRPRTGQRDRARPCRRTR